MPTDKPLSDEDLEALLNADPIDLPPQETPPTPIPILDGRDEADALAAPSREPLSTASLRRGRPSWLNRDYSREYDLLNRLLDREGNSYFGRFSTKREAWNYCRRLYLARSKARHVESPLADNYYELDFSVHQAGDATFRIQARRSPTFDLDDVL